MSLTHADTERNLLNHYQITNLYPEAWPAEKDEENGLDSDDERDTATAKAAKAAKAKQAKQSKRYTTLGRGPSNRSSVPGSQRSGDGVESLVQKDEADPLGNFPSVVSVLRQRGLPVESDVELRNRFMLSSTSFSPTVFLSEVHNSASTESLLQGLDVLSRSIEKKSASLKVLVESNFERFVRAKATIDNVYMEMRNHGTEAESTARPTHSRQTSRPSNSKNQLGSGNNLIANEKRKNALVKESEYGVLGIKSPLTDATAKAEEVWGPALGGREREEHVKSVLASIEQNRNIFETGSAIEQSIKRREYDILAEEYARALKFTREAKYMADRAKQNDVRLPDSQIHQIIITARVWTDVQSHVEDFKRDTWRRLHNAHFGNKTDALDSKPEEYMELISVLLQLGVEENPIWVWLLSRYDHLQNKIRTRFERVRVELEIQRRRLASGSKPSMKVLASHLRMAAEARRKDENAKVDTEKVVHFWEKEHVSLAALLSAKGGLLGEVIEYWENTQSFTEGIKQRSLPIGIDGHSRKHHRLTRDQIVELQGGAADLFGMIREQTHNIFVEPPIEDVSSLFTPSPQTPKTPMTAVATPSKMSNFTFDISDIPPAAPQTGEAWEKFAFWPPYSNSVSGVQYLSKIVNLIGVASAEITSVGIVKQDASLLPQLRSLVGDVRERSISAICGAWLVDSENCRELEDWTRSPEKPDLTNLPARFNAFETCLLTQLQKIMYLPEAADSPGSANVVTQPPSRHVETIQRGFKHSLYKAFSGIMEHAARPSNSADSDENSLTIPANLDQGFGPSGELVDASNPNVRKLLTIANFQTLRNDVIPSLIAAFETSFSHTITDDAKTARDVLSQLNARVFQAFVRPTVEHLRAIITAGISSPTYGQASSSSSSSSTSSSSQPPPHPTSPASASRPSDARPYVYDTLLTLVLTHTLVSRTSPALTNQILSYLLEQLSTALIDAFKLRPRYSLSALMQATLDVEFLAQTLDNYTTAKAGETQSQIYLALDERTDNEARQRLQQGLPEMRSILKRLREGTRGEFGCFKREKGRRRGAGEG